MRGRKLTPIFLKKRVGGVGVQVLRLCTIVCDLSVCIYGCVFVGVCMHALAYVLMHAHANFHATLNSSLHIWQIFEHNIQNISNL